MANLDAYPLIGITVGDPSGIGPEIIVKALAQNSTELPIRPIVYSDRVVLEQTLRTLDLSLNLNPVTRPSDGCFVEGTLNFIDCGVVDKAVDFGKVSAVGGHAGFTYLDRAIEDALSGEVAGLATGPLNKESLQAARLPFIDHTAVLKSKAAHRDPMTLFITETLRIFFLTRHISFREIPDAITFEGIIDALPLCELYLRQLGIVTPEIAVAALNPHGGEQGMFGTDEMDVIGPAVRSAIERGWRVKGPVPADSVFHQCHEGHYDGVLSLYHDQGHIAAKTLGFHNTVSLTMGLKFLRASVDHGTAFDIAGRGIADERGMLEALKVAGKYSDAVRAQIDLDPVS